jgi:hypothetical protein
METHTVRSAIGTNSILSHVPPGWELRPAQRDLLLQVEAAWKDYDIVVITAPTAVGKTLLGYIIARWQAARGEWCNYMAPTNVLIDQVKLSFPEIPVLHKKDYYKDLKQYGGARRLVKASPIRLLNYYVAFANKIYGTVQLFDEAHCLTDMLEDNREIKFWRNQYDFPDGLNLVSEAIEWAQGLCKTLDPDSRQYMRLRKLIVELVAVRGDATLEYTKDLYRGRAVDVLIVKPGLQRKAPDFLWPRGTVRKMVFMSATISREDIRELGLAGRKVKYLECESPIPPANRPLIFQPRLNMGRQYQQHSVPMFAKMIVQELAKRPEKGMIHVPYSLAEWLRELLPNQPRLLFHDKHNKQAVLDEFKASDPAEGKVLVASGMYEGIDLPYDAARWQIVGKVPYLSLGDEQVRKRQKAHPDWYAWEALKRIIQATGRIVRAPDDKGETLLWDLNFKRLLDDDKQRKQPLIPQFFKNAIREMRQ